MQHPVKAPSVGESITEVSILKWAKQEGQAVKTGEILLEIESDKATVEVAAEANGVLKILKQAGERIPIGEVIGMVDDAATATASAAPAAPAKSAPAPAASAPAPMAAAGAGGAPLSPAVRKAVTEQNLNPAEIPGTGKDGRLTKGDVLAFSGATAAGAPKPVPAARPDNPGDRRVPMTNLRARIAERLVQAQHTAAILTTFNECDMSAVMKLRGEHKDAFKAKHGVPLSFMSFFARACVMGLKEVPEVNAAIDGRDQIFHDYVDLGIAVGTERGLVVPVVRGAEKMGFVEIEKAIGALAVKARDGKLSIAELTGGTFTISNGGVYGSLMSTPILNPPQSGILGMHKIMERPIVEPAKEAKGEPKIVARPMMYLALSYDHRIIDGKGAVTFLIKVKEAIENPASMGFEY